MAACARRSAQVEVCQGHESSYAAGQPELETGLEFLRS